MSGLIGDSELVRFSGTIIQEFGLYAYCKCVLWALVGRLTGRHVTFLQMVVRL